MRSRASITVTSNPVWRRRAAAIAPDRPAPITAMRSPFAAATPTCSATRSPDDTAPERVPGRSEVASPAKKTRDSTGSLSVSRSAGLEPTAVKLIAPRA